MVNCVTPKGLGLRLLALVCLVALVLRAEANAQIVLDGSVGPAGALSGPDFAIGAELGTTLGPNLFHSFSDFNILTGESATFSGPDAIDNVVSRVTGGSVSTIDGLLRSTIAGADFYLVNPSGILFGANAALDVDGSFHARTADHSGYRTARCSAPAPGWQYTLHRGARGVRISRDGHWLDHGHRQ